MRFITHCLSALRQQGRKRFVLFGATAAMIAIPAVVSMNLWLYHALARDYQAQHDALAKEYQDQADLQNELYWRELATDYWLSVRKVADNSANVSASDAYKYNKAIDQQIRSSFARLPRAVCVKVRTETETELLLGYWIDNHYATDGPWRDICEKFHKMEKTERYNPSLTKDGFPILGFNPKPLNEETTAGLHRFILYAETDSIEWYMTLLVPRDSPIVTETTATNSQRLFWFSAASSTIGIILFAAAWLQGTTLRRMLSITDRDSTALPSLIIEKLHDVMVSIRAVPGLENNKNMVAAEQLVRDSMDHAARLSPMTRAVGRFVTAWDGRRGRTDVAAIAKSVIDELAPECEFRQEDILLQHVSDEEITKLFRNLLANARDHGAPPITVTLHRAVDATSGQDEVEVVVSNAGKPFCNANPTGLGLGILDRITKEHHGSFHIGVGDDGKGTTARARMEL